MKSEVAQSCSVVSDSLQPYGLQPSRLLCLWDFPGKSTGVSCEHSKSMNERILLKETIKGILTKTKDSANLMIKLTVTLEQRKLN